MKKSDNAVIEYIEKEIKEYLNTLQRDYPECSIDDFDDAYEDDDFLLECLHEKKFTYEQLHACQTHADCWDTLNDVIQFYIETVLN